MSASAFVHSVRRLAGLRVEWAEHEPRQEPERDRHDDGGDDEEREPHESAVAIAPVSATSGPRSVSLECTAFAGGGSTLRAASARRSLSAFAPLTSFLDLLALCGWSRQVTEGEAWLWAFPLHRQEACPVLASPDRTRLGPFGVRRGDGERRLERPSAALSQHDVLDVGPDTDPTRTSGARAQSFWAASGCHDGPTDARNKPVQEVRRRTGPVV